MNWHGNTNVEEILMLVNGKQYRAIWIYLSTGRVQVIDQRILPHRFEIIDVTTVDEFVVTIRDMIVRGAPLIGVTAAYGMAVAVSACLPS